MIDVQRTALLDALDVAAAQGSLLVIGDPGAGKTWALKQFARRRKQNGDGVILLYADDYDVTSLGQLQKSLGLDDLLGSLRAFPGNQHYLVIDSLDSLRGESAQKAFRELIRAVQRELHDWKIVASIRTFDAKESAEFQSLFPMEGDSIVTRLAIPARNLLIPVFSEDDLREATDQDGRLAPILTSATLQLRELLKNAFNLWLVIQLLDAHVNVDWFSSVQSDVQLLERYWQYRIDAREDSVGRRALLTDLTRSMVNAKALSVPWRDLYREFEHRADTFKDLLSDDVLKRGPTERISYTHAILFDFALSKLLLDENNLIPFLESDPARSIFFRPSVSYFFTRLWFADRTLFWKTAALFFLENTKLPPRSAVTPAVVIFETAIAIDDLKPLFDLQKAQGPKAVVFLLRAIEAFGGLEHRNWQFWFDVITSIPEHFEIPFVNELVSLLEQASAKTNLTADQRVGIGRAVIELLHAVWTVADTAPEYQSRQLTSLAAGRVVPIVGRLYAYVPNLAREVIKEILGRLGNPKASASEAYWLANTMEGLIEEDPALAGSVFRRVFSHEESSEEMTEKGGPVFSMTSTRAQDFSMAHYILDMKFQLLLQRDLLEAARTAIDIVTDEVTKTEADTIKNLGLYQCQFSYAGVKSTMQSDRSEIWDRGYRDNKGLVLVQRLTKFIDDGLKMGTLTDDALTATFHAIATANIYAVVWKRLLEFAVFNTTLFQYVLPLLFVPEILAAPETTISAGNLIEKLPQDIRGDHKAVACIESAVFAIPTCSISHIFKNAIEVRNRLLGRIPEECLSAPARLVLDELKTGTGVPKNLVPYKFGAAAVAPPTQEDWLREHGAHPDTEANQKLLKAQKPLKDFETRFINQIPSSEECAAIEIPLRSAYTELRDQADAERPVITDLFTTIATVAAEILKNEDLTRTSSVVMLSRVIMLDAANYPFPAANSKSDSQFDTPGWSPTPKIEAGQAVMRYVARWGLDDPVLSKTLVRLSQDLSPAVRFQVASVLANLHKQDRDVFWALAESMLKTERAAGVLVALLESITWHSVTNAERNRVVTVLGRFLASRPTNGVPEKALAVIADSLTQLFVAFADSPADHILFGLEAEPMIRCIELGTMSRSASLYLVYKDDANKEQAKAIRERASTVVLRVLTAVDRALVEMLWETPDGKKDETRENIQKLLRIVDSTAFRLYTALQVNPQLHIQDEKLLTEVDRKVFFLEMKPIWEQLTGLNIVGKRRPLAASTTQYLMETFNRCLGYDPALVLRMSASLLTGQNLGFEFDQMGKTEVVRFAETMLSDHKELLNDATNASALGEILDVFVSAGWPQATRLIMRLDDAVR